MRAIRQSIFSATDRPSDRQMQKRTDGGRRELHFLMRSLPLRRSSCVFDFDCMLHSHSDDRPHLGLGVRLWIGLARKGGTQRCSKLSAN